MKQNPELIDNSFYVEKHDWGTWGSYDVNGKKLVTSYTKNECISSTHFYLKLLQDNGNY